MLGELQVFDDATALAAAAAALFERLAAAASADHGRFGVALSGGSTPRTMLALLAGEPCRSRIDWEQLQVFWSDERAVPPDDPESNYRMAVEALLEHVPVPGRYIHRMPADRTPLNAAADYYAYEIVQTLGGTFGGEPPRFDLIMLGLGDDGHTASLFPETAALDEIERPGAQQRLILPNFVPRLNAQRLTFTPRLINAAANVLFLIAGASKAPALAAVLEGPREPRRYPAQFVAPARGRLCWFVDRAAASQLSTGGSS